MKKRIIFSLLILSSLLSGCADVWHGNITTDSNGSTTTSISDDSVDSSSEITTTTSTSTHSYIPKEDLYKLTLDSSSGGEYGSYSTGNCLNEYKYSFTKDGYSFSYHQALNSSEFIELRPYVYSLNDQSLPGAFFNLTPIKDIRFIDVTYYNTGNNNGFGLFLEYGESMPLYNYQPYDTSASPVTISLEVDSTTNYVRFCAAQNFLFIQSIDIYYASNEKGAKPTYCGANQSAYRIDPVKYEGTLESGVSQVNVPTDITISGDTYSVKTYKTLTYYSLSDFTSGKYTAAEVSLTDPFDIISYFYAFGEYPVNYTTSYNGTLGQYNRKVSSKYTRTDGYVNAIDGLSSATNFSSLGYYELDISMAGADYTFNNRGVGRIVLFMAGLNDEDYNNRPVALVTYDHYATFTEYLGYGFSNYFNAQTSRTDYKWSKAKTLTAN